MYMANWYAKKNPRSKGSRKKGLQSPLTIFFSFYRLILLHETILGCPDIRIYTDMPYFVSSVLVSVFFTKCPYFLLKFYLRIKRAEASLKFFEHYAHKKKLISSVGGNGNTNFGGLNRKPRKNVFVYLTNKLNEKLIGIGCHAHDLNNAIYYGLNQFGKFDMNSIIAKFWSIFLFPLSEPIRFMNSAILVIFNIRFCYCIVKQD